MPEEELGPLPAGRHGFSPEQVAHNQYERLIAGFATAVAEHGYNAVTIAHITKQARSPAASSTPTSRARRHASWRPSTSS